MYKIQIIKVSRETVLQVVNKAPCVYDAERIATRRIPASTEIVVKALPVDGKQDGLEPVLVDGVEWTPVYDLALRLRKKFPHRRDLALLQVWKVAGDHFVVLSDGKTIATSKTKNGLRAAFINSICNESDDH